MTNQARSEDQVEAEKPACVIGMSWGRGNSPMQKRLETICRSNTLIHPTLASNWQPATSIRQTWTAWPWPTKIRNELGNKSAHIFMLTAEGKPVMRETSRATFVTGWIVKPFCGDAGLTPLWPHQLFKPSNLMRSIYVHHLFCSICLLVSHC